MAETHMNSKSNQTKAHLGIWNTYR
uniref:Uncharacterized protein n=1 Tax=Arundo donax TaxID=35708 RepID=A0A0A8YJT1_ARUDO